MIFLIVGVALALVCGTAAKICANRKHRSGLWAYAAFAFPPFLLALAILPPYRPSWSPNGSNSADGRPKLIKCGVCGGAMSSAAPTCPHCGNKNRIETDNPSFFEWIGFATSAAVIGLIGYVIYQQGFDSYLRGDTFPPCDSRQAHNDAERVFASIPLMRLSGTTIVTWKNPHSTSSSPTSQACRANVLLSSGVRSDLVYTYTKEDDQIIIRVNLSD